MLTVVWMPCVACPTNNGTLADGIGSRAARAELRIPVLRVDRKGVLEILQSRGERLQLLRLRIVANRDEGFKRGLVVEPLVLVHLVRPNGGFERGVKLHPRHIAGVVIVGDKG